MPEENLKTIGDAPMYPYDIRLDGLVHYSPGIGYRHWLIGMALQGICANSVAAKNATYEDLAKKAIRQADALIEVLDKESGLTP